MSKSETEWEKETKRYYGRVIGGPDAHWCHEYDGLPINAFSVEYQNCLCGKSLIGKIVGWFMNFYWSWKMRKYCGGSFDL